jgi:hypothetical protein
MTATATSDPAIDAAQATTPARYETSAAALM